MDIYPSMKMVKKRTIISLIRSSNIVIIDHPHTSFIESLAINAPSLFFWNPNIYKMRSEAEEYFDLLREVGVLYDKPLEAAKQLIQIYDHTLDWWNQKSIQDARTVFLEIFGYSRKNWMEYWAKEIRKLGRNRN